MGSSNKPKKQEKAGNKQKNGGCFKCGEEGHFARDNECKGETENGEKKAKKRVDRGKDNGSGCYKCGENGHFARDNECKVTTEKKKKGDNSEGTGKKNGGNPEGHKNKGHLKRKGGDLNTVKEEKSPRNSATMTLISRTSGLRSDRAQILILIIKKRTRSSMAQRRSSSFRREETKATRSRDHNLFMHYFFSVIFLLTMIGHTLRFFQKK